MALDRVHFDCARTTFSLLLSLARSRCWRVRQSSPSWTRDNPSARSASATRWGPSAPPPSGATYYLLLAACHSQVGNSSTCSTKCPRSAGSDGVELLTLNTEAFADALRTVHKTFIGAGGDGHVEANFELEPEVRCSLLLISFYRTTLSLFHCLSCPVVSLFALLLHHPTHHVHMDHTREYM